MKSSWDPRSQLAQKQVLRIRGPQSLCSNHPGPGWGDCLYISRFESSPDDSWVQPSLRTNVTNHHSSWSLQKRKENRVGWAQLGLCSGHQKIHVESKQASFSRWKDFGKAKGQQQPAWQELLLQEASGTPVWCVQSESELQQDTWENEVGYASYQLTLDHSHSGTACIDGSSWCSLLQHLLLLLWVVLLFSPLSLQRIDTSPSLLCWTQRWLGHMTCFCQLSVSKNVVSLLYILKASAW